LWFPERSRGFFRIDFERALAAGHRHRTLEETARDVLAGDGIEDVPRGGRTDASDFLDPVRELEILRARRVARLAADRERLEVPARIVSRRS
jgi:hypothetical protein